MNIEPSFILRVIYKEKAVEVKEAAAEKNDDAADAVADIAAEIKEDITE